MNNCEIIQDLLPLYKDEVVSAASVRMIEEHLKTCEDCRNEFSKLQGEVRVSFKPTQKSEIGAFRLFKRKLLRRNVIISCISVVLAVVLLFVTYLYLDNNLTAIPYSDGLISNIGVDSKLGVINITSQVKPDTYSQSAVAINENGEVVRVVFINFCESVISKWKSNRNAEIKFSWSIDCSLSNPQADAEDKPLANLIYEPFDRLEVYYVNDKLWEMTPAEDYQAIRREGVLLWSGTFEQANTVAWKSFALENTTDQQRAERMTQFTLYTNGTMSFAPALISSYIPPRCTYSIEGGEMVFRAIIETEWDMNFFGVKNGDVVARFSVEDENTLTFLSAEISLFAEPNGRYVAVYPEDE
jgi:hypothetical protein